MAQAQSFGYKPQKLGYGYQQPSHPYVNAGITSPLAIAAAGKASQSDPFGLTSGNGGAAGYFETNPVKPATPQKTVVPPQTSSGIAPAAAGQMQQQAPGSAVTGGVAYDINTDPALQQANAFIGMNEDQARAEALKQKQQELLAYGDPNLVLAAIGDQNFAKAAEQNPTSTLAQLKTGRDRLTHDLTEYHNKQNTFYGGARIVDEQNAANDYQNALAQAAGAENSRLSGIDSTLAQALALGNSQRASAFQGAYDRNKGVPGVDPQAAIDATALPADPLSGAGGLGGLAPYEEDPLKALMLAAALRTRTVGN